MLLKCPVQIQSWLIYKLGDLGHVTLPFCLCFFIYKIAIMMVPTRCKKLLLQLYELKHVKCSNVDGLSKFSIITICISFFCLEICINVNKMSRLKVKTLYFILLAM